MRKILFVIVAIFMLGFKGYAQLSPPNMPEYDLETFHFGVSFGYASLYSDMVGKAKLPLYDTIMGFYAESAPALQIGFVSDMKIFPFLRLRCVPTLVLGERTFVYEVVRREKIEQRRNSLEIIYLEAPLELKIGSKRWHNFRPYLLCGMKYVHDIGSIRRKKLSEEECLMKLNNNEFFYTLGVGFDFYLATCKVALEFKSSFGLNDILKHDFNNAYTDCLEKIKSQLFYINLTFE